jgi:hypothetical protein
VKLAIQDISRAAICFASDPVYRSSGDIVSGYELHGRRSNPGREEVLGSMQSLTNGCKVAGA